VSQSAATIASRKRRSSVSLSNRRRSGGARSRHPDERQSPCSAIQTGGAAALKKCGATDWSRKLACASAEALNDLRRRRGDDAVAIIKSTDVIIAKESVPTEKSRRRRRRNA
jgi:hypothetical protein